MALLCEKPRCKRPRFYGLLCIECFGVEQGTRCAICLHDCIAGHGRSGKERCVCGCPEFVGLQEEMALDE